MLTAIVVLLAVLIVEIRLITGTMAKNQVVQHEQSISNTKAIVRALQALRRDQSAV